MEFIRLRFGREEVPFAYCYGSPYRGFTSEDLAAAAREVGAACGLTMESVLVDIRSDPFHWGRFNAFPWIRAHAGRETGWLVHLGTKTLPPAVLIDLPCPIRSHNR